MRRKTEYQRKQEAKANAALELEATKKRLGLGEPGPLRGAAPSPLEATSHRRTPKLAPTSDRVPGPISAGDLLHAHRWKRGAEETTETVKAIRRKATQIAPAYNKGALQYLPAGSTRITGLPVRSDQRAASNFLASEICRNADARLSSVGELQASGFEHLPETIHRALAEFFAALKADNGFGRNLRGGGQFPGAQANRRSCHSALYGQHLVRTFGFGAERRGATSRWPRQ